MKYKNLPQVNGKENILAFSRHIAIGCSCMFTKKIKEQMLPFTESVMAHDWINVYLAAKQNGIACIDEPLFEYRLHSSNAFGERSLKQNLSMWKQENGKSYKAYKKYRNERVIKKAYLDGSLMCLEYRNKLNLPKNKKESGFWQIPLSLLYFVNMPLYFFRQILCSAVNGSIVCPPSALRSIKISSPSAVR